MTSFWNHNRMALAVFQHTDEYERGNARMKSVNGVRHRVILLPEQVLK